jgi:hypothetical protein
MMLIIIQLERVQYVYGNFNHWYHVSPIHLHELLGVSSVQNGPVHAGICRYMPVYQAVTSFCSGISHRHLSIYELG